MFNLSLIAALYAVSFASLQEEPKNAGEQIEALFACEGEECKDKPELVSGEEKPSKEQLV